MGWWSYAPSERTREGLHQLWRLLLHEFEPNIVDLGDLHPGLERCDQGLVKLLQNEIVRLLVFGRVDEQCPRDIGFVLSVFAANSVDNYVVREEIFVGLGLGA